MKNLAIIPARGGSKRIPHKNIKEFLGKPIIAYSIEAALKSGLFDEVMVSTDDEQIAAIAKQYGASVPFMRSAETANDHAIIADVLNDVLNCYDKLGKHFDNMCCILATAPLLRVEDLQNAYNKLTQSDFVTVIPIVQFSFPIMRSFKMDEKGMIEFNWPEYYPVRSQDIHPAYHDAGMFYWHKIEEWRNGVDYKNGYVLDDVYVQDIDTETDWKLAEMKYMLLNGK
jgi:N-acylneuraminate cytidylyltransferase